MSNLGYAQTSAKMARMQSERWVADILIKAAQISKALEGRPPKRPISIMIVNGTKDPLVPYEGGTSDC